MKIKETENNNNTAVPDSQKSSKVNQDAHTGVFKKIVRLICEKTSIKKEKLLIVAGAIWAAAGVNILRIGLSSFIEGFRDRKLPFFLLMILLSAVIFIGFSAMFRKVVKRNTARIISYPSKKTVFAFFDGKGYILMAFMMGLGITLRGLDLLPIEFFAVFYTGLGTALTIAGVFFIVNYFRTRSRKVN